MPVFGYSPSSSDPSRFAHWRGQSISPVFSVYPEKNDFVRNHSPTSASSHSLESMSLEHKRQADTMRALVYLLIPVVCILIIICLGLTLLIVLPSHIWTDILSPYYPPYLSPSPSASLSISTQQLPPQPPSSREADTPDPTLDKDGPLGIRLTPHGPLVDTRNGIVIGSTQFVDGKLIASFLGIPYALPPIDSLRFRKPVRIPDWGEDAIQAVNFSSPCVQFVPSKVILTPWISSRSRQGSEDCLYLNIWAPVDQSADKIRHNSSEGKTVMVWIHGGAFFSGSADVDLYDGSLLSSLGDVIVVSLNYRLGALGFLTVSSSEDGIAPGNMGMYDQVLALEWIRDNIIAFGGDPDNIVLFGQSAGATSAGLHLFSPMSRDIPSRVILQSGSPLFPKIYFENHEEKGNIFLQEVGCANTSLHLTDCLQSLSVEEIIAGHEKLFRQYKIPFFPRAGDDFLPDLPHESIHDQSNLGSQTEILIGNNEDEGSFFLHLFFPDAFPNEDISRFNLSVEAAKDYISRAYSFIPENQAQLMSQFFMMNLKEGGNQDVVLKTMHDIIGDSGFVCPAVLFSELMSEYNVTVYHYLMTGRPTGSAWHPWMGSTHLDEVQFVFGVPLKEGNSTLFTDVEKDWSERLISTWTIFAKTGRVPPQLGIVWPHYTKESPAYLDMNATHVEIKSSPHKLSCNMWKIIYDSFL